MKTTTTTFTLALGLGIMTMVGGCGYSNSNTMAEAWHQGASARYEAGTGELYRIYSYYPQQETYRSEYQDRWFYRVDGEWVATRTLPAWLELTGDPVMVQLPTSAPSEVHQQVVLAHPSNTMLEARIALSESRQNSGMESTSFESSPVFATVPTDY